MEAVCSAETLVTTYKVTRRHNPEDHNHVVHTELYEDLSSSVYDTNVCINS
jgi:hypothetical protein